MYVVLSVGTVCSRTSEVVYPLVDKNTAMEPVSMTPLYKTLQSYMTSMQLNNSKRFTC